MSAGRAFVTTTEAETRALGAQLGRAAQPGLVVLLRGDLGAGKTTLVQGFAGALPAHGPVRVKSPTYALCHAYPTTPRTWHADLYRLARVAEVEALGVLDAVEPADVLVVEWAERAQGMFPDALVVDLAVTGEDRRDVTMMATGPVSAEVLARIQ
ncbi:MAG: tRNA (adenosine(37)-N6)-threonylcarbamoyltransferase complex ATPase subunit type 1 TsaE [Deltaproteobacteria bacterium]|nr:tRNA (adenosine(37)-N6)-threonylcarbamoyltransferase complex ATPase subunit type 1 TsaE [Deltaproteobacteria bacterium]